MNEFGSRPDSGSLAEWKELKRHPLSELFPDMDEGAYAAFAADMAKDGYDNKQPILLYQGKVMDGWQRHRAAVAKDKMPTFENYKGDNPLGEVIRRNMSRRHLSVSQRAMIAAKLSTRHDGENKSGIPPIGGMPESSHPQCVHMLKVSLRSIERAEAVLTKGTPELQQAVAEGDVSVSDGAAIADKPPDVQNAALQEVQQAKKPKFKSGVKKKKKTLREAVAEDLAKEDDSAPKTIEEVIAAENSMLEKYARELGKLIDEMPETPWLIHDDRRKMAMGKGKDVCTTVRTGKCYRACPMCKGQGCKDCHKSGRVTKYAYDQLV